MRAAPMCARALELNDACRNNGDAVFLDDVTISVR
jgi:hypothetical protein